MNELHFANRVRQLLNHGLHELQPSTTSRLAAAREQALARQKQAVGGSMLATVGGMVNFQLSNLGFKQAVATLAVLACLVGTAFWVADQRVKELSDIDSALLTDDLPIGAFTDKGFDAWLKRGS